MAFPRPFDRRMLVAVIALALCGLGALCIARRQVESTRCSLVERRLVTAVDILRGPATEALGAPEKRPAFLAALNHWGSVTGLRLTLIEADGSVVADTEVPEGMPNLSNRPEVHDATRGVHEHYRRTSAVTGKDTIYTARSIEKNGVRLGVIRAATDAREIEAGLAGIEGTFAILAACCLGSGLLLGLLCARKQRTPRPVRDAAPAERIAA
jgi:hypothetical protein